MKTNVIISIYILLTAILVFETIRIIKISFTTNTTHRLVKAYNPVPTNRATNVSPKPTLSWSPGKNAVAHDVYFSENLFAVYHATRQNPMGVLVSQGQDPNFYDIGQQLGTQAQCYWRVDETDNQGNIITGDAWSFKVYEYKGMLCFTRQTPVWVGNSLEPISDVVFGQSMGGVGKIEKVQEHDGIFTLYDIVLESGNCITVAENHYFMTESGNWISLHDLRTGMRLKTSKGSTLIRSITKQPLPFIGKVYNLEIQGSDQYMVGEDAVIVRDY